MIDEAGCDKIDSAGIKSLKVFVWPVVQKKVSNLYGRDLSRGQMVNVGEAIGMISAQSIKEQEHN